MNLPSTLSRGALLLCIVSLSLLGAPIVGTLNIGGSVAVSQTQIDFFLPVGPPTGDFTLSASTQSGSFVPLAGTTGTIKDLASASYPTGTPISLMNWMTFAADPNLSFELTYIQPGSFSSAQCSDAPASGQTCTPFPQSPFNLSNSAAGSGFNSTIAFGVSGVVHNGQTGELSSFIGAFSTQFVGQPYQDVLKEISAGRSVQATYSANFTAAEIPEPATFAICGAALLALGFVRRRVR